MDTTINKIKETINSAISAFFLILLPPNTGVFSTSITQIYGETMEGDQRSYKKDHLINKIIVEKSVIIYSRMIHTFSYVKLN
ncbi:hypothetical protein CAT7_11320 [Carnobacterium sp. AT7]|uniref:hypothetical protein n=1 Tax=Carnobacterium sp. AT7 TaxID=333990 RepID=UPI00015F2E31|nr:hypothetical protein [Carnobacterium sp. AT7]EDP68167.1 hypothetical protein CAT7_11320 [Carnobacterium sp. AT7]